jgi:GNAT superfamily N-acetyltransferase
MSDFVIRDAMRSDVPAIVALLAADSLGARREYRNGIIPQAVWTAFERIDGDPNNRQIVAVEDGAVVGCLQMTYIPGLTYSGGTRVQIEGVRISHDRRRRGIGRRMFEWVFAEARDRGAQLAQLTHHKSRDNAAAFYRKLGFTASHVGVKFDLGTGA